MSNEEKKTEITIEMVCPLCYSTINREIKSYMAKLIPEQVRVDCCISRCRSRGRWNVNNGHAVCDRHFRTICEQGDPVIIHSVDIMKKKDGDEKNEQ